MAIILSVQKIWDKAKHNGLPDLIFFQDNYYAALRESDEHAGGEDGKIRILISSDTKQWKSVALLEVPGRDLRDPMLSEMPDGRLMLSLGGSQYEKEKYLGRNPAVSFSKNGLEWTPVSLLENMSDEWIWRVTWHKGTGYGASYWSDPLHRNDPSVLKLFKTKDGLHYIPIQQLEVPDYPSEATLRFAIDDTMIALVRRHGGGWIGNAAPPYQEWHWNETEYRFGGPNFLIFPEGNMWAGSRLYKLKKGKWHYNTALFTMSLNSFDPVLELPSSGDTGYPGMVYRNGLLYMCYYSSHEGKTMIYLATIDLEGT